MNNQLVKFSVNDSLNQSSLHHKSKRSERIPYFFTQRTLKIRGDRMPEVRFSNEAYCKCTAGGLGIESYWGDQR